MSREIAIVLQAGDVLSNARSLRDLPEEHLDHVRSPKVLRRAANLLRAGAYSATVAALRLERRARQLDLTQPADEKLGEVQR